VCQDRSPSLVLILSGAALAGHEHKWGDSTLQVKIGLVAVVAVLR
jgi:hypothetical protein